MKKVMKHTTLAMAVVFLSALSLLSGCAVPSLKPFADATATLDVGVKEGGSKIIESMKKFPFKKDGKFISISSNKHPANRLNTVWAQRIQAMDALIVYSASLANISNANINARNNVEAFAETVKGLADYIPSASVYSGDVKTLVNLLITTGVEIKSYHTLSKAVEKAQKPLSQIVFLIKDDLNDLEDINKNLRKMGKSNLTKSADVYLAKYNGVVNLRTKWWKKLSDPAKEADALIMVNKYDDILNNLLPKVQEGEESVTKFMKKSDELSVLLVSTKKALDSWKTANDELALALKDNRQPNIALFVIRATEIKNAVDKLKD